MGSGEMITRHKITLRSFYQKIFFTLSSVFFHEVFSSFLVPV